MQPRGGHLSSQLGIRKRLVRRLNQPMTARLMKTARSLKVPHEIVQILFPAALPPRLPWLGKKHEEMISLVKRCHMMCHVKNYQGGITWRADRGLGCGENGTICLHSNVIRIGEEDTTKRKKVTKTGSSKKNKKQNKTETQRKQTKESSGPSCQPTSRWVPQ